ncbi:MAG: cob(I)yrinic acid a,c-diamide adenosyltransferase [Deltaproteobacteria bacterium]|nr:cob(I)yrinic acid a,c-diamide adenosyltransferase [Deltaproteobacteria bacterium]RLB90719.1 MAG: cob(I)yrinic acid a,c-diamide adenosyltransferase [Deltaproteobacteria bacterium]RLC10833.1 MAG: cob(I)yrinic acid a,c-diamide adenosyltransferase [Deltaproteobacteria bacterium]
MGLEKGLIQVYTGEGKGKTTAALGLAMRALGRGLKVIIIQFMKGQKETGELNMARRLSPHLVIKPMGRDGFVDRTNPDPHDIALARTALDEARRVLSQKVCDILVLDEINVAVSFGLIDEHAVLELMDGKPADVELVLTGRYAPDSIIQKADLVTTMECTKHYFDQGEAARVGIEF